MLKESALHFETVVPRPVGKVVLFLNFSEENIMENQFLNMFSRKRRNYAKVTEK